MERDDERLRRMAEQAAASDASDESSEEDQTHAVREGVTRAIHEEEIELRRGQAAAADSEATSLRPEIGVASLDPGLERPPDLPEALDVTSIGPGGRAIGRGSLTDPLGNALGGSTVSSDIRGAGELGGAALGGSRLDPLGLMGGGGSIGSSGSDLGGIISANDGSHVSSGGGGPGTDEHFGTVNEIRGARGLPDLTRDEYDQQFGNSGSGSGAGAGDGDSGSGWRPEGISAAAWQAADDFQTENMVGWVKEYGAAEVFPADDDDKSAAEELQETLHDSYIHPGGEGGDDEDEDERPDPTADYDVVTGEALATAVRTNDPGVYSQPTQDSASVQGYATNLADNDPDNITNYGPDGPQNVEVGDNWAPPPDLIFDPAGADSAMADPAGSMGGSSVFGSSTPDEAPPPPDPPPGDDPDQGPLGPPGGGGGEG